MIVSHDSSEIDGLRRGVSASVRFHESHLLRYVLHHNKMQGGEGTRQDPKGQRHDCLSWQNVSVSRCSGSRDSSSGRKVVHEYLIILQPYALPMWTRHKMV